MCAIAGYYHNQALSAGVDHEQLLDQMLDRFKRLGYRKHGRWLCASLGIALAHGKNRPAKFEREYFLDTPIDLPFVDDARTVVVSFDGELYNVQQLKSELILLGYQIDAFEDAELVAYAYRAWGISFLDKLDGVFAIALFDIRSQELFLIRDRMGDRPLCFFLANGAVSFASELKALWVLPWVERRTNLAMLPTYLTYGGMHGTTTFFHQTYRIPAGTYIRFDRHLAYTVEKWYEPFKTSLVGALNLPSRQDALYEHLEGVIQLTVKRKILADTSFGALLSGGVDSALVVSFLARFAMGFSTYSFSFDTGNLGNEFRWARRVARYFGTNHAECVISERDAFYAFPAMSYQLDEPCADVRTIHNFLGFQAIGNAGMPAVFGGDGLDELFGGQTTTHKFGFMIDKVWHVSQLLMPSVLRQVVALAPFCFLHPFEHLAIGLRLWCEGKSFAQTLSTSFDSKSRGCLADQDKFVHRANPQEYNPYFNFSPAPATMQDIFLASTHAMAAAACVSVRSPFLDHRLVDYITHHRKMKTYQNNNIKNPMRQLGDRLLPPEFAFRGRSRLEAPLTKWFRNGSYFRVHLRELLHDTKSGWHEIFDFTQLRAMLTLHEQERIYCARQLWTIYVLLATDRIW